MARHDKSGLEKQKLLKSRNIYSTGKQNREYALNTVE